MMNKISFLFISLFAFVACGPEKDKSGRVLDTPTSGTIRISVDETYEPIMKEVIDAFMAANPDATIIAEYKPEADCFKDLLDDSTRTIIVSRILNGEEKEFFKAQKTTPTQLRLCRDAIALITSKSVNLETVKHEDIMRLFRGEISSWNQIGDKRKDSIRLVFDNANSSTVRYFTNQVGGNKVSKSIYAVKTNAEVIDYVSKHPSAIGFIGVNWISNADDSSTQSFIKQVNVLEVMHADSSQFAGYGGKPFQYTLAKGYYPFYRDMISVSSESRMGLGTAFVNYMVSDKGQAIFRLAGLLPLRYLTKEIEVKSEE